MFDLRGAVCEVAELHRPAVAERGISHTLTLAPESTQFTLRLGDDMRVVQTLNHLLGNAAKFTLEDGISVHLDADRTEAVRPFDASADRPFDLYFLEIAMSGMNGIETLAARRQRDNLMKPQTAQRQGRGLRYLNAALDAMLCSGRNWRRGRGARIVT
ncbi:MAG: hypothetical protein AAF968_13475 [Pseudomonadota bacterium]